MASAVLLLLVFVFAGAASGFVRLACALGDEGWRPPALVAALAAGAATVLAGLCLMAGVDAARAQDCPLGAYGCGHAESHDLYREWNDRPIIENGVPVRKGNCCNGQDCRPVRADQDADGGWKIWVPEWRMWVAVPPAAVGPPDRFHDGRSHACTSTVYPLNPGSYLQVHCFSPAQQKS